jgi:SAM-dependent methyltransferase
MTQPTYFAKNTGDEERARLAGFEDQFDTFTERRLRQAGLEPGKRCLEVGAGIGSIARLMGKVSGRRAIAADLNPRFLDPQDPHYEIRQWDLAGSTDLGEGGFDLVHCRLLLMHLPDPAARIRRLASLLGPKGALVLEEPDTLTIAAADRSDPRAEQLTRVCRTLMGSAETRGLFRSALGPELPGLMARAGLASISCEGMCEVLHDGGSVARRTSLTESLRLLAPAVVASGELTRIEVDQTIEWISGGTIGWVSGMLFSCIGFR